MKKIKFTITEDEIREVSKDIGWQHLSGKQVQSVLAMVECDEMLWKDINKSIIDAIRELFLR